MRGLCMSGGGSRIDVLLAASLYVTEGGYHPDWYAGVSSGLLSALAIEFGIARKLLVEVIADRIRWIKRRPITNESKFTFWAFWHLVSGKNYLGVQDEMAFIRQYIDEKSWEHYRLIGKPIYGMAVCVEDGEKWIQDLRCLDYERMLLFVAASCRVPFWTEPVLIDGKHWADGGWRDHNPSVEAMKIEKDTTEIVSLSTRPIGKEGYPSGLVGMLNRVIAVYGLETTKEDERMEELYCLEKGIYRQFFRLPDCKNHPYDTNSQRSKKSVAMALDAMKCFKT